jgi:hypothetical protein
MQACVGARRIALAAVVLGGCASEAQELWHFGTPNAVYGIYRRIRDPNDFTQYIENRIGHIDTKVMDSEFNGKPCRVYTSTAYFSPKPREGPQPRVRKYETWIAPNGDIIKFSASYEAWRTYVKCDGVFMKDAVDLTVTKGLEQQKLTLYPAGGLEEFRNPFMAIVKEADKDRKEVAFCAYDVSTSGILKYKARVVGKWKAEKSNKKYEGATIEVTGNQEGTMKFYVSNEGELMQVDLPDGVKVYAQQFSVFPDGEIKRFRPPVE